MARARSAIADIKIRLREPLRVRIEMAAAANGNSMNLEMVRRLERSFVEDDVRERAFGPRDTSTVMNALGIAAGAISDISNTNWLEKPAVYEQCRKAFDAILDGMKPRKKGGSRVSPALGEAAAIAVLEQCVRELKQARGLDPGEDDAEIRAVADKLYLRRTGA